MKILKALKVGTFLTVALILGGCAHPDLIDLGEPEATVVTELGTPDSKMVQPDGSFILVYSMQPFGQEVYWMRFDKDGRYVGKERAMNEEHFKLVIPGKHTKQDVFQMFGRCAQEYNFKLQNQTAFMYRFRESSGHAMAFWVQFDTKDVVTETAITQDPWDDRGDPLFNF